MQHPGGTYKIREKILPISVNLSRASIHYDNMICRYVKIVEEMAFRFLLFPLN